MWSKNSFKIFEYLLRNPVQKFNVNQIAKNLKLSVGSAFKILKEYEKKGILSSEKLANSIFYQFNYKNKEARKICELMLINIKNNTLKRNHLAAIYADELIKLKAEAILLFGSILTKKEQAKDVDVLVIIKNKSEIKRISNFCLELSKIKTRPIIPLILTEKDLIGQKDKAILEILKTGIVLTGEELIIKALEKWQE